MINLLYLGLLILCTTELSYVGVASQLSKNDESALESFWWEQPADTVVEIEPKEIASNTPQINAKSGGLLDENTACEVGFDCVDQLICVNGVIDVDGGGLISKRIKQTTCTDNNVCCRIPGYVEPLGTDQCGINEDCVSYRICTPEGVININGENLLDKRIGLKPPSTCTNHEYPSEPAVCCLRPYKCPEYQECVQSHHCGPNGLINRSGTLQSYFQNGITCRSDDKTIEGVCCVPGEEIVDSFPIADKCGIRNNENLTEHIQTGYGKEDAFFGEFPWQAIIFLSSDTDQLLFKCAGTLITDRQVLTAAHCVEFLTPADIGVRLGEYEVSSEKELKKYVDRNVIGISTHPDYSPTSTRFNLAVIHLEEPVNFDYHINTICIPQNIQQFSNRCVAAGWGKNNFEGDYQHILKKLELPYVEHDRCQNLLRKTILSKYFRLHPSLACAGGEAGQDTCTGDGGGPLACLDEASGQYYLAGIVNAGFKCGEKDVPGLYSNVPHMFDWIESVILEASNPDTSGPSYPG